MTDTYWASHYEPGLTVLATIAHHNGSYSIKFVRKDMVEEFKLNVAEGIFEEYQHVKKVYLYALSPIGAFKPLAAPQGQGIWGIFDNFLRREWRIGKLLRRERKWWGKRPG